MIKQTKGKGLFKNLETKYKLSKRKLPLRLANDIQLHFLKGFQRGGGSTDKSAGGWAKRKTRTARQRSRSNGRALLVDTGSLRADIQKRKITFNKIVVGTKRVPYASYVNEGTSKMPQREFIGKSKVLEKKIQQRIEKELNNLFK